MEDETQNIMIIHPIVLVLVSLGYCHFLVTKIPKGTKRLLSLLPVLFIFSILPWRFSSSALARGLSSFFITWISSFKLLLFSFNKGPLLSHQNYIDFVVVCLFPFKMKQNISPSPNLPPLLKWIIILLISSNSSPFLSVIGFLYLLYDGLPRYEMVRLFNHPYLATSLQDFWGRRWNRMSSDILRQTVYDPTRQRLSGVIGFGCAKVAATIATLVVSGIMHELVLYYITCGNKPTWEVAWFFVLHGFCMVLEAGLKHVGRVKGWDPIHPAVSIVLTVGFAIVTCYWLLVLPVWRNTQSECRFRVLTG
ncbi:hypothetical protein UlMin_018033 [Ulmus minor]